MGQNTINQNCISKPSLARSYTEWVAGTWSNTTNDKILYPYCITGNESLDSIAKKFSDKAVDTMKNRKYQEKMTYKSLTILNYGTDNPREINWYLKNFNGCNHITSDGNNYFFSNQDKYPFIWIPLQANKFIGSSGEKIKLSIKKAKVEGPSTAEFGARILVGGRRQIRTYEYKVSEFSRELTKDEKNVLNDLEWAVRIGTKEEQATKNKKGFYIIPNLKGISINLPIKYEYAESKIFVGPVIDGKVHANLRVMTNIPFSVPLVPEIMKKLKGNYTNAIKLQEKWFNTQTVSIFGDKQSDSTKVFDNSIIKLNWVKGFKRGKKKYDEFVNQKYWFSDNLKKNLLKNFENHKLLGRNHDVLFAGFPAGGTPISRLPNPQNNMLLLNSCYEQHLAWKGTELDTNDDLKATLANCDWRMAFEGVIKPKDAEKKQLVQITRCAVFIRDSFDYVSDQELGDWRANPPDVQNWNWTSDYTDVNNEMYRNWRTANGMGHDFLVFSDVEYLHPQNANFKIRDHGK